MLEEMVDFNLADCHHSRTLLVPHPQLSENNLTKETEQA
ncbi:hypothetical protein CfE428DRAFT_0227 [Chthoniobacter flavus Ellin428]|uniref:Uncharacterized protein n=1 Tax=Chthoniobacter flavus Ellin428 TaxID=497964 RepID=B4CU64_9BACT|nr:hypothetical protein CfE428DRAFT_0227 [Chthoniobacter flavus Ellin428]